MARSAPDWDPITSIEASYGSDGSWSDWLAGIGSGLDRLGYGHFALAFEWKEGEDLRSLGSSGEDCAAYEQVTVSDMRRIGRAAVRRFWAPAPPVDTNINRMGRVARMMGLEPEWLLKLWPGFRHAWAVLGADPAADRWVSVGLWTTEPRVPPRLHHTLTCISAHIAAGLRLRCSTEGHEAVLDQRGRLLDGTEGAVRARRALSEAVMRMESARGALRRTSPLEAARLWEAMLLGRWTLVEHAESDGKRFILAKRNPPQIGAVGALQSHELQVAAYAALGHSNKLIGYELGIAPSTVATHLSSAIRKLGLRTRDQLVQVFGPLAQVPQEGAP